MWWFYTLYKKVYVQCESPGNIRARSSCLLRLNRNLSIFYVAVTHSANRFSRDFGVPLIGKKCALDYSKVALLLGLASRALKISITGYATN